MTKLEKVVVVVVKEMGSKEVMAVAVVELIVVVELMVVVDLVEDLDSVEDLDLMEEVKKKEEVEVEVVKILVHNRQDKVFHYYRQEGIFSQYHHTHSIIKQ